MLNIKLTEDMLGYDIYLYDILGNKLMTVTKESMEKISIQVDISDKPSGIYILKSEFGEQRAQKIYLNK